MLYFDAVEIRRSSPTKFDGAGMWKVGIGGVCGGKNLKKMKNPTWRTLCEKKLM